MLLVNIATLTVAVLLCLWVAFIHAVSPEPLHYRIFVALFAVRLAWMVRRLYRYYQRDSGEVIPT